MIFFTYNFFSFLLNQSLRTRLVCATKLFMELRVGSYSFLFIVFRALMVSSFLLGLFLFCPSKRVHPGGLQEKK